jgi:hypothetical protein
VVKYLTYHWSDRLRGGNSSESRAEGHGDDDQDGHDPEPAERAEEHVPLLARRFYLSRPARPRRGPHLIGRKQRPGLAELVEPIPDHPLRGAVHRRGVDQPAAAIKEVPYDLSTGGARRFVIAHVEGDPAAEADDQADQEPDEDGMGVADLIQDGDRLSVTIRAAVSGSHVTFGCDGPLRMGGALIRPLAIMSKMAPASKPPVTTCAPPS